MSSRTRSKNTRSNNCSHEIIMRRRSCHQCTFTYSTVTVTATVAMMALFLSGIAVASSRPPTLFVSHFSLLEIPSRSNTQTKSRHLSRDSDSCRYGFSHGDNIIIHPTHCRPIRHKPNLSIGLYKTRRHYQTRNNDDVTFSSSPFHNNTFHDIDTVLVKSRNTSFDNDDISLGNTSKQNITNNDSLHFVKSKTRSSPQETNTRSKIGSMASSIQHALNQKLNQYDKLLIQASSRKHAVSPILPTLRYNDQSPYRNLSTRINNILSGNNNTTTKQDKREYDKYQVSGKITSTSLRKQQKHEKRHSRKQFTTAIRNLWKKRNARSIEEGIRRGNEEAGPTNRNKIDSDNENNSIQKGLITQPTALTEEDVLKDLLVYENNNDNGLSSIQQENPNIVTNGKNGNMEKQNDKRYIARTISGLISALAEEATGVNVNVEMKDETPIWQKHVDKVSIQFERLGIKQLKMGGLDEALQEISYELPPLLDEDPFANVIEDMNDDIMVMISNDYDTNITSFDTPDDIFNKIDVDKSGALDAEELTSALLIASGVVAPNEKSMGALERLAQRLVRLYDTNGDGVIDRDEYKKLVADMTAVRNAQRMKQREREMKTSQMIKKRQGIRFNPLKWGRDIRRTIFGIKSTTYDDNAKYLTDPGSIVQESDEDVTTSNDKNPIIQDSLSDSFVVNSIEGNDTVEKNKNVEEISNDPKVLNAMTKGEGSIVLENLKLDLRRLLFGALPVVKKITPGGPLILEPFTVTVTASFNRKDILDSVLLDDGLRRLVARALRRRVRSIRDLLDGAVFYGRTWNMASKQAPIVEVPKLTNIEFDKRDRLIITGKAKVRTSPDQPVVENSFKLRTKLGTRENGQYIRLEEPELALMLECPKSIEKNIVALCKSFKLPIPTKPDPIEQFFPLVSPIKMTEDDGFNLGEDNRIKSIFIKDNALRFEISTILSPGRYLGNHYLAFGVPNRTFIITMDRIREGIRNARRNKRNLRKQELKQVQKGKKEKSERYDRAVAQALSKSNDFGADMNLSFQKDFYKEEQFTFLEPKKLIKERSVSEDILPSRPGFFGRFLEGYLDAAREESERDRTERLTTAISEFFSSDSDEEVNIITELDAEGKPKHRGIV